MSINESKGNQIMGVIFTVLGLLLYFLIIPMEISEPKEFLVSPRFFPNVVSWVLTILGVALFVFGWLKRNDKNQKCYAVSKKGLKLVGITFGILIIYVIMLYFIPYIFATILILALLIFIYGQRNYVKLVSVSIGVPILIYLAFTYLLKLVLP